MLLLEKSLSELKSIIKTGDSEKAPYAAQIVKSIQDNTPDFILKREQQRLYRYYDYYENYKNKSLEELTEYFKERKSKLKAIEILIILHLVLSYKTPSNVIWQRLKPATLSISDESIIDQVNFIIDLIKNWPEQSVTETVSECQERLRILPKGLTANPGIFRYRITPYLRKIADCLSISSNTQEAWVEKANQIGFNVGVLEAQMLYCIEHGLGPLLYVGGDQEMAEEMSDKRIDELIYSSGVQDKIKPNIQKKANKSTGDTIASKSYSGTFMRFVGPKSESKLRQFQTRFLQLDELEVYPQNLIVSGKATGNPIIKAIRRTDSYESQKKIIGGTTPKHAATSQIEPLVEEGNKQYYNWRCPKCKNPQPFLWSNFKWDKNEDGAPDIQTEIINGIEVIVKDPTYFQCAFCDRKIRNHEKYELLLEEGYGGTAFWQPTKKSDRPFIESFVGLNAFYGFRSWIDIALQWEKVKDDPLLRPDFINDVLAETYKEQAEKPDEHELMQYAEDWEAGAINDKVVMLTLAADIQADRIEAALAGWGRSRESWITNYWTFPEGYPEIKGNPIEVENIVWNQLYEKITDTYIRDDGIELNVQVAFIDSGYLKDQVNTFCDRFSYHEMVISGVFPVVGRESQVTTTKEFKNDIQTPVVGIDDQKVKFALYNTLKKRPHKSGGFPYGYMHFPKTYGLEFYKQLTAEDIYIETNKKGIKKYSIENRKGRRNEVLDIIKMNMAAFQHAMFKYFELENKKRREQKRKEIEGDTNTFIEAMEEVLSRNLM